MSSGWLASVLALAFMLFAGIPALAQRPRQPAIRIPDLERRIADLVNKERVSRKLNALELDERLSKIARAHSQDMARHDFFDHVNPDGQDPTARATHAGYQCGVGENLYQSNLYRRIRIRDGEKFYDWNSLDDIAADAATGWMRSSGHRHNILEPRYRHTGLGVAVSADDKVYITQMFC